MKNDMNKAYYEKKDEKTLTITREISQDIPVLQLVMSKKAMDDDFKQFTEQTEDMTKKLEDMKKLISISKENKLDVEILENIKNQIESNIKKNESQMQVITERLTVLNEAVEEAKNLGMDTSIPKQVQNNESENTGSKSKTK